jgi:hypothetical protein
VLYIVEKSLFNQQILLQIDAATASAPSTPEELQAINSVRAVFEREGL